MKPQIWMIALGALGLTACGGGGGDYERSAAAPAPAPMMADEVAEFDGSRSLKSARGPRNESAPVEPATGEPATEQYIAYSHNLGKSLALAYVEKAQAKIGNDLEVEILGERFPAKVIAHSPWDPENQRIKV